MPLLVDYTFESWGSAKSLIMKRLGNCWKDICTKENIERAFNKSVIQTRHELKFGPKKDQIIQRVYDSLRDGSYKFGEYNQMILYTPKRRVICYPKDFASNVIQNALLNILKPWFLKKIPSDSYASMKDRGLTKAVNKLKRFIKYHPDWYFFQGDIRHFFQNINHDVLKKVLRTVLKDKPTLECLDRLIDSYPEGIPIGNQLSPYLANLVLYQVGHKIKEEIRAELMIIYMDDIVVCFPNKDKAKEFSQWLIKELEALDLYLKPNWRIAPMSFGIDFLGYIFYPTHTRLRKGIKLNMQKKAKQCMSMRHKEFKRQLSSHYGWCCQGNCTHLMKKTFKKHWLIFKKFRRRRKPFKKKD